MSATSATAADLAEAAAAAFTRRDFNTARNHAEALLQQVPNDLRAMLVLGLVAVNEKDFEAARRYLSLVKASPPPGPSALNSLGSALAQIGDTDGARAAFGRAGELGLLDGWRNLGNLESGAKNWSSAIDAFQRIVAAAPADVAAHAALAHIFEIRHDFQNARARAQQAIALDPLNAIARVAMARSLIQQGDFAAAEAAALPVAQSERASNNDRSVAWGVVGDARDRAGDAAAAFDAFTASNQLALSTHASLLDDTSSPFHPESIRCIVASVRADIGGWSDFVQFETPAPVFLVGFPRSGTTLLDQILSSHSGIVCLEERPHFSDALTAFLKPPYEMERVTSLSRAQVSDLRTRYWRAVEAEIQDLRGKVVVDKLPLNIVLLPMIKCFFPDAKIILALRDPRDAVLSCFQHRFQMNVAMAQFLQLETAAAYYDLAMQVMEASQTNLALDVHQVRYENVVFDLEQQARSLADFLGLAYESSMLNYRETALRRNIQTPSMRQVIQPLYAHSVGRWRRYAEQLKPILHILRPWAERFGYPP